MLGMAIRIAVAIPVEVPLREPLCLPVLQLPCWMGAMPLRFPKCLEEMDLVLVMTAAAAVHLLPLLEAVVPVHRRVPARVEAKRPRRTGRNLVAAIAAAR